MLLSTAACSRHCLGKRRAAAAVAALQASVHTQSARTQRGEGVSWNEAADWSITALLLLPLLLLAQMLAVVSAIFLPITFLAGVYGTNFDQFFPEVSKAAEAAV